MSAPTTPRPHDATAPAPQVPKVKSPRALAWVRRRQSVARVWAEFRKNRRMQSPLELTFACIANDPNDGDPPANRGQLYARVVRKLLKNWPRQAG